MEKTISYLSTRQILGKKRKVLTTRIQGVGEATIFLNYEGLTEKKSNSAYIHSISVSKKHRKKGYGKQIIYHIEKQLLEHGIKNICADATPPSIAFWNKLGYKKTSDKNQYATKMCKRLN